MVINFACVHIGDSDLAAGWGATLEACATRASHQARVVWCLGCATWEAVVEMPASSLDDFVHQVSLARPARFPTGTVVWHEGDEDAMGRRRFRYLCNPAVQHVAYGDPNMVMRLLPMGKVLRGRLNAGDVVYVPGLGADLALLVLMRVPKDFGYLGKTVAIQPVERREGRWRPIGRPHLLAGSLFSEGYVDAKETADRASLELLPSGLVLPDGGVLPTVGTSGDLVGFDSSSYCSPAMFVTTLEARAGHDLRDAVLQHLPVARDRMRKVPSLSFIYKDLPVMQLVGTVRICELLGEIEVDGDVCMAETRIGLRTFTPRAGATPDAAGS